MFRFLIAFTLALAVYGKVYTENPKQQLEMWKEFKEVRSDDKDPGHFPNHSGPCTDIDIFSVIFPVRI